MPQIAFPELQDTNAEHDGRDRNPPNRLQPLAQRDVCEWREEHEDSASHDGIDYGQVTALVRRRK